MKRRPAAVRPPRAPAPGTAAGPMHSMTGYGRGVAVGAAGRVVVECSSVNRRQLEVVVQLPGDFAVLEARVRELVAAAIPRGRVLVNVSIESGAGCGEAGLAAAAAAAAYRDLSRLRERLGIRGEVTIGDVLRHPACSTAAVSRPAAEALRPALEEALGQALAQLAAMRQKEGASTAKVLQRLEAGLELTLRNIQKLAPRVPVRRRAALLARIAKLEPGCELDPARLTSEVALLADRCDISEEIARIESHLEQFRAILREGGPHGRTLEFLVQELQREYNTTGAKAADAQIAKYVVASKAALEKIREQLANLE